MTSSVLHLQADWSEDAEQAVISAILVDEFALISVRPFLQPEDFLSERCARIYRACLSIADRSDTVDPLTVAEHLARTSELDACGGKDYIGFLIDFVPTTANVEAHARIVVDRAKRRALVAALDATARLVRDGSLSVADVAERLQPALEVLANSDGRRCLHLLDDEAIQRLPAVPYLIDGLLPVGAACEMHGPPASGKTFVALDFSLSVASGLPFFGHAVRRSGVLYIAAEGAGGLGARVAAWKQAHNIGRRVGVEFVTEAVNLLDEGAVSRLLRAAGGVSDLGLVVFDTWARCMVGGDENSAQDTGRAIQSVDRIRRETGATVLLLHHPGAGGERERGSTALRGAMDKMIAVKKDGRAITLVSEKAKDDEPFAPLHVWLSPYEQSCVLTANAPRQDQAGGLTEQQRAAVISLSRDFLADGASTTQWQKASGIPERSFYRARRDVVTRGYVRQIGVGRGSRFVLTPTGAEISAASLPKTAN